MRLMCGSLAMLFSALLLAAQSISTEKVISDLEYKWAQAQRTGNVEAVNPLLADGFINTDADGNTYGKSQLLSNLKGGKWTVNGISDVKVSVYDSTAVATGSWTGKGVDGDGTPIDRSERWTDTWVKMPGGNWLCVASQQTATSRK